MATSDPLRPRIYLQRIKGIPDAQNVHEFTGFKVTSKMHDWMLRHDINGDGVVFPARLEGDQSRLFKTDADFLNYSDN